MTPSKPRDSTPVVPNPGTGPGADWLAGLEIDEATWGRRAAALAEPSPISPEEEARELVQVVRLLDLTSLSESDTDAVVRSLCARARQPLQPDMARRLGLREEPTVAAVCVHDRFAPLARSSLEGSDVRVAAVTGGFPTPHAELPRRLAEIRAVLGEGADEVDVVITRELVRAQRWEALYAEVAAMRQAAGPACLKVILAAGELGALPTVARTGLVCCMAGADFIKTSTGRERVNATLPMGLAMAAAIRAYAERTGRLVGLKPAGGIRDASTARSWLHLAREELGKDWLDPMRFRIGASALLTDVERRVAECAAVG